MDAARLIHRHQEALSIADHLAENPLFEEIQRAMMAFCDWLEDYEP